MKDLVSIIIPAYNHEKYIYDCINSVLNQTYTNIEVLVEDDCSTDKTREVISKIKDDRLKKIYSKKNKGVVNTINELSNKCNGKYIAVIGSDDIWYPTKIEEQVQVFEKNPKLGAVFTEVDFIDENGKKYTDKKVFNYENVSSSKRIKMFYDIGNHLCHPSSMIRQKVFKDIGEYNNAYRQLHDYDYWTRLLQKYDVHIINKKLMAYRRNRTDNKSISASNRACLTLSCRRRAATPHRRAAITAISNQLLILTLNSSENSFLNMVVLMNSQLKQNVNARKKIMSVIPDTVCLGLPERRPPLSQRPNCPRSFFITLLIKSCPHTLFPGILPSGKKPLFYTTGFFPYRSWRVRRSFPWGYRRPKSDGPARHSGSAH